MNPLFNALGGGQMPGALGNFQQMMQQFQQFRATFQGDLEAVHKLTDTIKNIDKIEMLEADGYSNHGGGDWEARGNYDGMYRDDRYSRRGRDMRGRYSRHDGTDKRLMDELEELMRTIEPGKRDVIRRALEELKEA